jgi:hypothetical protein
MTGTQAPSVSLRARLGEGPDEQVWGTGIEPVHAGVAAEPGLLAAGESPGSLARLLARLVEGELTVQVAEHLLVAQGPAGGPAVPQALVHQIFDLGFEACLPHAVDPGGDPLIELRAGAA